MTRRPARPGVRHGRPRVRYGRSGVRYGRPVAVAAASAAALLAGCTGDDPAVVGDPSACAGRVSGTTLDATFPGYETTVGGFGDRPYDDGGCAVRGGGRRLAEVTVLWVPSEQARRQALEQARDTSSPPRQPTDLGPDVAAGDDSRRSGGVTLLVGEFRVVVVVEDADNAAAAVDAAVALARDVRQWYVRNPVPTG